MYDALIIKMNLININFFNWKLEKPRQISFWNVLSDLDGFEKIKYGSQGKFVNTSGIIWKWTCVLFPQLYTCCTLMLLDFCRFQCINIGGGGGIIYYKIENKIAKGIL